MSVSFGITKKAVEQVIQLLDAVPARSGVSSSEFIKVDTSKKKELRFTMTSDISGEAFVKTTVEKIDKPLFIDRRMFFPFVTAGKEFEAQLYEFTIEDSSIKIKHGSRISVLENNVTASGYETLPSFEESQHVEITEEWSHVAECALLCACFDPAAPSLNCVHIMPAGEKTVKISASDTKLVFQGSVSSKALPCSEPIALPLDLISSLDLFQNGIFYYTKKFGLLQFPVGRLWQAVKAEARKSFPFENISAVVEAFNHGTKPIIKIGSSSIFEAGSRIANYMASVSKDNPALRFTARADKKLGSLDSATVGAAFSEKIELLSAAGKDVAIDWPLLSVLPILQHVKNAGTVRIYESDNGSTALKAGNVMLVVGARKDKKKKGK